VLRRGPATVVFETDRELLVLRVRRILRTGGGTVAVPEHAVSSSIELPVIKQALRNNCETAALSMLLTARGVRIPQLVLQRRLPRNGPLDPRLAGDLSVWGDPQKGFVGRVDGGGTSGGFGVYERPISALAARSGVRLTNVTGQPAAQVYRRVLAGRPVMAWVGLSAGPYKSWRTAEGRRVVVNLGEHSVVLAGIRGDSISVNDPLSGSRVTWSRAYFQALWDRLGRRALAA